MKKILELPCDINDLIYEIDLPEYGVIVCRVQGFMYTEANPIIAPNEPPVLRVNIEVVQGHGVGSWYSFELSDFDKSVFTNRENAEQILKNNTIRKENY